jgi:predicted nucleic acid-binding protein
VIVVSDTSPLTYLHQIDRLELLPRLFGEVLIPGSVAKEWEEHIGAGVRQFAWLRVGEPRDETAVAALLQVLDRGEAEAIVLAEERRADLLLIDEKDGRAVAAGRGLTITGVLGVLLRSKQEGLISNVRVEAERLVAETNFFCNLPLLNRVLALAGEPPLP